jgi:hypothetical protein
MTETFKLETLIFFYPNILNLKLLFSFILKFKTWQTYSIQIEKTYLKLLLMCRAVLSRKSLFSFFSKKRASRSQQEVSGFGFRFCFEGVTSGVSKTSFSSVTDVRTDDPSGVVTVPVPVPSSESSGETLSFGLQQHFDRRIRQTETNCISRTWKWLVY